jgi:hypothetical protein
VGIGTHLYRPGRLPLVHEGVHVAHDRIADLVAGLGQDRDRADVDHLMHCRRERDGGASHPSDERRPHTAGHHDVLACHPAPVGDHRLDPAVLDLDVEDLGVGEDLERAQFLGPLPQDRPGPQRVHDRHRGGVEASQDHRLLDERHLLLDLGGVSNSDSIPQAVAELMRRRSSSIRSSVRATSIPPQVVLTPISSYCRWDSRVSSGKFFAVVDREDEVGGVPGGATRIGKRPLVDLDDVLPALLGQVPDDGIPDDAGTHHDHPGFGWQVTHFAPFGPRYGTMLRSGTETTPAAGPCPSGEKVPQIAGQESPERILFHDPASFRIVELRMRSSGLRMRSQELGLRFQQLDDTSMRGLHE